MEPPGAEPPLKIAIPRINPQVEQKRSATSDKHRVSRACMHCRTRKVKCSGELPRCRSCEETGLDCTYTQNRKDRLKDATTQNRQLIVLLRDLSLRVGNGDRKKIDDCLGSVDDDPLSPSLGKRQRGSKSDDDAVEYQPRSPEIHARGPSLIDENVFRSPEARAIGFVGQTSEVQWLRTLRHSLGTAARDPSTASSAAMGIGGDETSTTFSSQDARDPPRSRDAQNTTESTFYLDRDDLGLDEFVDEFELPLPDTAETLVEQYMSTIHTSFPILPGHTQNQLRRFIISLKRGQQLPLSRRWRAMLNLVFAIASHYARLIHEWRSEDDGHLVYMTRAVRLLDLKDALVDFSVPDLALIQATGLLSLYYLVSGHVSRAWIIIGFSLRWAVSVGLHLKNEDQSVSQSKKEILVRTWWGLHSIECLTSVTTGRPCVLAHEDCTVPFPRDSRAENVSLGVASESSSRQPDDGVIAATLTQPSDARSEGANPSSLLDARIRIGIITQRALALLYTPSVASASWDETQAAVFQLIEDLDGWRLCFFPNGLSRRKTGPPVIREQDRLSLAFTYYGTMLLVTKKCLLEPERRPQGNRSARFKQEMAEACVQAAHDQTNLLPDNPDPDWLYRNGPWWCIVHHIMQAMAVFLLELSYGRKRAQENQSQTSQSVRKLTLWLRAMQPDNAVAERACRVLADIFKSSASVVPKDIIDLVRGTQAFSDPNASLAFRSESAFAQPSQTDRENVFQHGTWQNPTYFNLGTAAAPPSMPPLFGEQPMLQSDPYQQYMDATTQEPVSYDSSFLNSYTSQPPVSASAADLPWSWPPYDQQRGTQGPNSPRRR